jgi:uncharacterized coiled-coil protein SlyX
MEQTVEHLVAAIGRHETVIHNDRAEMKAMQEKMGASLKKIKDIRTNHKEMNASQERAIAEMDAWLVEMTWRRGDGLSRSDGGLSGG